MASKIRRPSLDHPAYEPQTYIACGGRERDEDPQLARQRAAGEEDQSQPGWDQGA